MPIFTERSLASTFQTISARLSNNGTMVTFASDTFFLDKLRPRDKGCSEGVAAVCSGFLRTILGLVAETASVSLRTLVSFLSIGTRYLFLLQRLEIPFDFLSLLLIQFSHVWRQSFVLVIRVSDLYSSSPWFATFNSCEPISCDEFPCHTNPIRV